MTPHSPSLLPVNLGEAARAAGIRAAFTTRAAGNLALDVGGPADRVHASRGALREWAGGPVRFAHHVHGVAVLDPSLPRDGDPTGDAWATAAPAALGVLAADCLPVLLFDPAARVIGAAHAGRVGVLSGVLTSTVNAMRALGAGGIHALVGPAICGSCYEISPEMARELVRAGVAVGTSRWGTPSIDLPRIAAAELHAQGVNVTLSGWCTREDPRFFSHRSPDRAGGRHAGLIAMGGGEQEAGAGA